MWKKKDLLRERNIMHTKRLLLRAKKATKKQQKQTANSLKIELIRLLVSHFILYVLRNSILLLAEYTAADVDCIMLLNKSHN